MGTGAEAVAGVKLPIFAPLTDYETSPVRLAFESSIANFARARAGDQEPKTREPDGNLLMCSYGSQIKFIWHLIHLCKN